MFHACKKYNDRVQDSDDLIPDDEPVFLLRAQDKHAAKAVRHWAELVAPSNPQLAEIAFSHADRMDHWPIKKDPDV